MVNINIVVDLATSIFSSFVDGFFFLSIWLPNGTFTASKLPTFKKCFFVKKKNNNQFFSIFLSIVSETVAAGRRPIVFCTYFAVLVKNVGASKSDNSPYLF